MFMVMFTSKKTTVILRDDVYQTLKRKQAPATFPKK